MRNRNNIKEIKNNNGGYSLVELLVSVLLLTIIVVAFLSVFQYATRNNITSGQVVDQGYVAQTRMEDIIDSNNTEPDFDALIAAMATEYASCTKVGGAIIEHIFTGKKDGYNIKIVMKEKAYATSEDLVSVFVGVYEDSSYSRPIASVQNIITK